MEATASPRLFPRCGNDLASRLSRAAGVGRLLATGWLRGLDVGRDIDASLAAATLRLGLEERVAAAWRKVRR